jgi:hypothetical protein
MANEFFKEWAEIAFKNGDDWGMEVAAQYKYDMRKISQAFHMYVSCQVRAEHYLVSRRSRFGIAVEKDVYAKKWQHHTKRAHQLKKYIEDYLDA